MEEERLQSFKGVIFCFSQWSKLKRVNSLINAEPGRNISGF